MQVINSGVANPEHTSPEFQNKGMSGSTKRTDVLQKKIKETKKERTVHEWKMSIAVYAYCRLFLLRILLSTFWRSRYTPQTIDLDHKLKPFIPDFIPAVGDIDAFIKVNKALFHGQWQTFLHSYFIWST